MSEISKLHYITQDLDGITHAALTGKACSGGISWVQLRVKDKNFDEWLTIAKEVKEVCNRYQAHLIINDNAIIAKEINAYGVHLGKEDMSISKARKILGDNFVIGGTANSFEDIERLASEGADYIGLGPFRFTDTKKNLSPILGFEGYQNILTECKSAGINLPVIAIGGIKKEDVNQLLGIGVHGIAISSAINLAADPKTEACHFIALANGISWRGKYGVSPLLGGVGGGLKLTLEASPEMSSHVKRKIIPYNPKLNEFAKQLRKSSTPAEKILWTQLKGKKIKGFDFDRQRPLDEYIVDFYCKELMLAIEIDGYSHKYKMENDAVRQKKIESFGIKFLRFSEQQVKTDIDNVLRNINIWVEDSKNVSITEGNNKKLTPSPSSDGDQDISNHQINKFSNHAAT